MQGATGPRPVSQRSQRSILKDMKVLSINQNVTPRLERPRLGRVLVCAYDESRRRVSLSEIYSRELYLHPIVTRYASGARARIAGIPGIAIS